MELSEWGFHCQVSESLSYPFHSGHAGLAEMVTGRERKCMVSPEGPDRVRASQVKGWLPALGFHGPDGGTHGPPSSRHSSSSLKWQLVVWKQILLFLGQVVSLSQIVPASLSSEGGVGW